MMFRRFHETDTSVTQRSITRNHTYKDVVWLQRLNLNTASLAVLKSCLFSHQYQQDFTPDRSPPVIKFSRDSSENLMPIRLPHQGSIKARGTCLRCIRDCPVVSSAGDVTILYSTLLYIVTSIGLSVCQAILEIWPISRTGARFVAY
jgi:hypothetical protein